MERNYEILQHRDRFTMDDKIILTPVSGVRIRERERERDVGLMGKYVPHLQRAFFYILLNI